MRNYSNNGLDGYANPEKSWSDWLSGIFACRMLIKRINFFVGAGIGNAKVDVEIDTCLDLLGCSNLSFTDTSGSATAYQYMVGLGFAPEGAVPAPSMQYFVGFRMFQSADLGITDSLGVPYSDDQVKMPMAFFGFTKRFQKRSSTPPS